jgi:glutamate-1-semialdehyde 2,1-aminomutase
MPHDPLPKTNDEVTSSSEVPMGIHEAVRSACGAAQQPGDADPFRQSRRLSALLHRVVPGGCHTYAKGDDQFPQDGPSVIERGLGCHVWDVDGNEFIEYGMGLRAVTLGHAFPAVLDAVREALGSGTNFTRPARIELEAAEEMLGMLPFGDMVKFTKDGSSVTTAAVKLARAHTGRDMVAYCGDHPFFATHDWFMGTTAIPAGTLDWERQLSVAFRYNDPESLEHVLRSHPGRIACVILEPAKYEDPRDHFLHRVRDLCEAHGCLFVLDEMITGFRWDNGGAQRVYDIEPDLSCFGKGLANGFSVSALVGKRKWMEVAGLYHDRERVFLLSTTHGAETHALAAAIATMRVYQHEPVVATMHRQGEVLAEGVRGVVRRHGLESYVQVFGQRSNFVFGTKNPEGKACQGYRTLLMQELIARGVLAPSLVVSYSHSDEDIRRTVAAFDGALAVYAEAIQQGLGGRLRGRPSQVIYRGWNDAGFRAADRPTLDGDAPQGCSG